MRKSLFRFYGLIGLLLITGLCGCATYYQQMLPFHESFREGDMEKADKILNKNKKQAENRNRLLYFLNSGVVQQMEGNFEESNEYFEKAYIFCEDVRKNYALEAVSYLTNPMVTPYYGEDFEIVLIHYYKALNYLRLNMFEEALVEARRINIKLNELNDKYKDKKNRYSVDAFAWIVMGIAYDATGETNNAFIAYRNAYEAYRDVYEPQFGVKAPQQLKMDLLRTAYQMGFKEELLFYEKEFGITYKPHPSNGGELIFFWHNGLGPIKHEWSINFVVVKGEGGMVTFVNEELGLSFPFFLPEKDDKESGFGDLKVVRVAFPKYVERKPFWTSAQLEVNGKSYQLEEAENINNIAFKTLQDRMLRELGKALLRLAVKQASEYAVRQKSDEWGAVLSIINAISEKADTRNWQTLPYSISYTRVPLKDGENTVEFESYSSKGQQDTSEFHFTGEKGETRFHIFHSLESQPIEQDF